MSEFDNVPEIQFVHYTYTTSLIFVVPLFHLAYYIFLDTKDFNQLGIGLDDLIEAFIQSTLSMIAIDKMAVKLMTDAGKFRYKLFKSLNNDESLMEEILIGNAENTVK